MKDPAFLFYPGDYFRDTQCLSDNVQAVYVRIMCEHMRNICISHTQLAFFTKNLSAEETSQLLSILIKTNEGYQIEWVVDSILKRKAYTESRRNNRKGKPKENDNPTKKSPSTYVSHMENEGEIESEIVIVSDNDNGIVTERGKGGAGEKPNLIYPFESENFLNQWKVWKQYTDEQHDFAFYSETTEQAALSKLGKLSKYDEATAIAIMHQSMANGWKGFFEEIATNGSTKQPSGKAGSSYSDAFKRKIVGRLQSE